MICSSTENKLYKLLLCYYVEERRFFLSNNEHGYIYI